ncbi:hypothetical protein F5880DRAFT_1456999, partial [Lentinula raphanica]
QVEETLFRFPINLLAQESPVFRDMMEIPTSLTQEGLTDDDPIRLDGVLHDDFVQLLTILAPPQRFKQPVPSLSFSEWTSVLKLADMWCMDAIREHAIMTMNQIEGVDPVEKLVVARTYRVDSWLPPSLDAIIRRSQDWSEYDVERLGLSTVEGTLFRFPLNLLAQESTVFKDMMDIPAPSQEGLTDDNPIRLDGVLHDDFVQLLTILAPPQRFKQPVPTLSFSEWTSILKLADMWCMDAIREHAISTMKDIPNVDPVDKVVVAKRYGVDAWLPSSLDAIIRRSQAWSEHDVERLGLSTVLKLVALRD